METRTAWTALMRMTVKTSGSWKMTAASMTQFQDQRRRPRGESLPAGSVSPGHDLSSIMSIDFRETRGSLGGIPLECILRGHCPSSVLVHSGCSNKITDIYFSDFRGWKSAAGSLRPGCQQVWDRVGAPLLACSGCFLQCPTCWRERRKALFL